MGAPDLTAVKAYLGNEVSASDEEIAGALAAEATAQSRVCRLPEPTVGHWWVSGPLDLDAYMAPDNTAIPVDRLVYGDRFVYPVSHDKFTWDGAVWNYDGTTGADGVAGQTFWVDPVWPADLSEALCRRVHRNLVVRGLPLGLQTSLSDSAVAVTRIGSDGEIRRLEAPYRKLPLG